MNYNIAFPEITEFVSGYCLCGCSFAFHI